MNVTHRMLLSGLGCMLVAAALRAAPVPARLPPNVVLILTDDRGWGDVAYNGHPVMQTPELDKMAAAGMRLDRFYAAASVCSPTRVSCLTGRNNWRVNITGPVDSHQGHLPQEEITLAEALKPAGYVSGHFGKWHVGGFDKKRSGVHYMPPWHAGFDECFSSHNVLVTFNPYAKMHKHGMEAWTESRYKTVRATKSKKGATEWQLYDLLEDPFEERNLAASKPEVLQRMVRDFAAWAGSVEKDRRAIEAKY